MDFLGYGAAFLAIFGLGGATVGSAAGALAGAGAGLLFGIGYAAHQRRKARLDARTRMSTGR